MTEKFEWDDGCLVVPYQPEQNKTAVYTNGYGDIVLRQKTPGAWKDDYDKLVSFRPEHAEAIIRAIIDEVGLPYTLVAESGDSSGATVRKFKDVTATERQRRRRAKLRERRDPNRDKSDDVTSVTAAQPPVSPDRVQLALVRTSAAGEEKDIQGTALTR
ncbi:hypothetical protein ABH994_003648 [Bradyrhizobium yuanmingense]|uniref:hypothetical protein n=1 Tax=Bradyrhizobium yuanmingense TaxID=108015 RepID=UPI00351724DD